MRLVADASLANWSLLRGTIPWPPRNSPVGHGATGARLPARLSRLPRLRHLEAGAALHLTDQRADVVVGRALKHRVLVDEARRLADPHRHAQLLALRDGQIDILHQDMHCGSIAERAIQYRIRPRSEERRGGKEWR